MWEQPHFIYHIEPSSSGYPHEILDKLEGLVPGCLVYSIGNGRLRYRLGQKVMPDHVELTGYRVMVPIHGAWLVEGYLQQNMVAYAPEAVGVEDIRAWSNQPFELERLSMFGHEVLTRRIMKGEVKPFVRDLVTPYQLRNIGWADQRPWVMNVWPCGSGKTLGSLLSALTRDGPILVVCPAKARHVWWSQVQEYTNIKPYRVVPRSNRRKSHQSMDDYMRECRVKRTRPFIVVGAESLADYIGELQEIPFEVLILDELHTHGSRKRWKAIQEADGSVSFERYKTKMSDKDNRAVAIMDASRMKNVSLCVGLTATPLDDGRPRRLWSQLDLLCPGGFAYSYSKFANRYCDARPGDFGGLDDKGASNIDELRSRCSFFTHEVPYSESHSALPSTRVQVVYLSQGDLVRSDRFSDEQTFNQALRGMNREAKVNPLVRERIVESRLAEACSRKRRYVVDEIKEGLKGGGKVVVFTARRREAELWAHQVRKALKRGDEAMQNVPVWMGHGGVSEQERDEMVDTFRESDGPCCLIGTGQAFGVGVDGMQTADLAIFAMLPWKPGDFVQWKGRFDRLGGRATLLKVVVATGTYDERVVEILTEKFGPIEQFLSAEELRGLDEKLLGLEDQERIVDSIIGKLEIG